jgi:hypothetical protein
MPLGPHLELSDAWGRFVGAVRRLWEAESTNTNRPQLVHYKLLVEEALSLATDAGLVAAMQESFLKRLPDARAAAPIRFYILELSQFASAVDAHMPAASNQIETRRDLLSVAGTIVGSAKDIFDEDLPWWGKAALRGFGEVAELCKKKGN